MCFEYAFCESRGDVDFRADCTPEHVSTGSHAGTRNTLRRMNTHEMKIDGLKAEV